MRNMSKIVGLLAALLLVPGRIGLAADLPDLVPWKEGGGIGIENFSCTKMSGDWWLKILIDVKNIGTAKTTVPVKVLVKVNGAVWKKPITWSGELPPNYRWDWGMDGRVRGPGTYTLWVKVDPDNGEAELNENNNEATAVTTCGTLGPVGPPRPVEPPKLYPKPKIGPPPVEQPYVPPAKSK